MAGTLWENVLGEIQNKENKFSDCVNDYRKNVISLISIILNTVFYSNSFSHKNRMQENFEGKLEP